MQNLLLLSLFFPGSLFAFSEFPVREVISKVESGSINEQREFCQSIQLSDDAVRSLARSPKFGEAFAAYIEAKSYRGGTCMTPSHEQIVEFFSQQYSTTLAWRLYQNELGKEQAVDQMLKDTSLQAMLETRISQLNQLEKELITLASNLSSLGSEDQNLIQRMSPLEKLIAENILINGQRSAIALTEAAILAHARETGRARVPEAQVKEAFAAAAAASPLMSLSEEIFYDSPRAEAHAKVPGNNGASHIVTPVLDILYTTGDKNRLAAKVRKETKDKYDRKGTSTQLRRGITHLLNKLNSERKSINDSLEGWKTARLSSLERTQKFANLIKKNPFLPEEVYDGNLKGQSNYRPLLKGLCYMLTDVGKVEAEKTMEFSFIRSLRKILPEGSPSSLARELNIGIFLMGPYDPEAELSSAVNECSKYRKSFETEAIKFKSKPLALLELAEEYVASIKQCESASLLERSLAITRTVLKNADESLPDPVAKKSH